MMMKIYLIPREKKHVKWVTLAVLEYRPILSATKPPITGPRAGPRECVPSAGNATLATKNVPISGPKLYTAIADALPCSAKRSPMQPPPIATGALPAIPAIIELDK
jgi:hypothetical protein